MGLGSSRRKHVGAAQPMVRDFRYSLWQWLCAGRLGGFRYRLIPYVYWINPVNHRKNAKKAHGYITGRSNRQVGDPRTHQSKSTGVGAGVCPDVGRTIDFGGSNEDRNGVREVLAGWVTFPISIARDARSRLFRVIGFPFAEISLQFPDDSQQ